MSGARRLTGLADVTGQATLPGYDPAGHGCGIVHLGAGAFHRAHQAVYTDDALARSGGGWRITGENEWKFDGEKNDPYQTEHDDFFASIRAGKPLNEGRMVAESTMTAIMGRMATYSGKEIRWEDAISSDEKWGPDSYEFGPLPVDPVPMPGQKRG